MRIIDRNSLVSFAFTSAIWLGFALIAHAQTSGDQLAVPFSDPSRPGTVNVSIISGSISVKGYGGKEVVVETKGGEEDARRRERPGRSEAAGLKRIPNFSGGLTVEEQDNVISIAISPTRPSDIALQVPSRTTLRLKTINGHIKVEQVQGEIEVNVINGGVTLTQVSGAVIAHALNHDLKVTMAAVAPDKPMSFSSLRGDIDVALPPDIKANVSMKADNGEIYSDFDIKLDHTVQPLPENKRREGGKYRIRMDRTTRGTINGGGPEIQFKTFNGNIYIRKAAK